VRQERVSWIAEVMVKGEEEEEEEEGSRSRWEWERRKMAGNEHNEGPLYARESVR
jgi:hypothetical protein